MIDDKDKLEKEDKVQADQDQDLEKNPSHSLEEGPELNYTRLEDIPEPQDQGPGQAQPGQVEEEDQPAFPKELAAGFWIRFFSFLVDILLASALAHIILDGALNLSGIDLNARVYSAARTLIVLLYFTISSLLTKGQSIGKLIFGLRVARLDGEKLDPTTIFIREFIGRFIHSYSFLWILYLVTAFTPYKQNISDIFADTTVLDLSKVKVYQRARQEG